MEVYCTSNRRTNRIINAEVHLQVGDNLHKAKVIGRAIGPDGRVAGEYDDNPMLNSIVYDVEFNERNNT
jgi:hypothetical protein